MSIVTVTTPALTAPESTLDTLLAGAKTVEAELLPRLEAACLEATGQYIADKYVSLAGDEKEIIADIKALLAAPSVMTGIPLALKLAQTYADLRAELAQAQAAPAAAPSTISAAG